MNSTNAIHSSREDFDARSSIISPTRSKPRKASTCAATGLALQRLRKLRKGQDRAVVWLRRPRSPSRSSPARMEGAATTPLHLVETSRRSDLEKLVADLVNRTFEPCKKRSRTPVRPPGHCRGRAGRRSDRLPRWREVVNEFFGKSRTPGQPTKWCDGRGDPGRRAAGRRQGRAAARRDSAVAGIETLGGVFTRDRPQHHHPTKKSQVFSTADDNQMRSPSESSRVSARWPPTIRCWASSTWSAFPRRRAACRISKSRSTSNANGIVNVSGQDKAPAGTQIRIQRRRPQGRRHRQDGQGG